MPEIKPPTGQRFIVSKAADWDYSAVVEIDTVDDLKNLSAIHGGTRLIIDFALTAKNPNPIGEIIIYDGYVE